MQLKHFAPLAMMLFTGCAWNQVYFENPCAEALALGFSEGQAPPSRSSAEALRIPPGSSGPYRLHRVASIHVAVPGEAWQPLAPIDRHKQTIDLGRTNPPACSAQLNATDVR